MAADHLTREPTMRDEYQRCPNCKAVLPAGQTCDCRDRLDAALREAEERQ